MFRRYFFLWFAFFLCCFLTVRGYTLVERWRSADTLERVRAESLTAACLHDFNRIGDELAHLPDRWNWSDLHKRWAGEGSALRGMAVEDRADGRVMFSAGFFQEPWVAVYGETGNRGARWIDLDTGERVWTALPAGEQNPRFRLWLNFGSPISFAAFVETRRLWIAVEAGIFSLLFVLFYWRLAAPGRHVRPMVETVQRALEHADSPLQVPLETLPGEFVPLGKAVSLVLEARRNDHQERHRLSKKADLQSRQKTQYTRMVKQLESSRDSEQSAVEKVQNSLLETNREPVLLLDRTRRILSMNEAARRALSLSGQTGYPLRHSELEKIIDAELSPPSDSTETPVDPRISIRDPFRGNNNVWKVSVEAHSDWQEPNQIQCLVIGLNKEESTPNGGSSSPEYLLRSMADAWAETWTGNRDFRAPLTEAERTLLDTLIRELSTEGGDRAEIEDVRNLFHVRELWATEGDEGPGEVSGSRSTWRSFAEWFQFFLEKMTGVPPKARLVGANPRKVTVEWTADSNYPFDVWFGSDDEKTAPFRKEMLNRCLDRIRAKVVWDPTRPSVVRLEILLKAPSLAGRRPTGIPMKVEV